jgi:hypothetical protein
MEEAAAPAGAAAAGEAAAPETNAISPEEVSALLETNAAGNVRPYDLTAHRVNLARLPALEAACKSLAEKMAAASPAAAAPAGAAASSITAPRSW